LDARDIAFPIELCGPSRFSQRHRLPLRLNN
jgi:hypothetical protein